MTEFRVRVECDLSEVDRDLARISRGPNAVARKKFDAILTGQFLETQVVIHRITGSLAASGHHDSTPAPGDTWEGFISYGGSEFHRAVTPGPARNPGEYAEYEFEKPFDERYNHNWIDAARLDDTSSQYAEAITDWMRRGIG